MCALYKNFEVWKWGKDFPGGPVVKILPCDAGAVGWIPGQAAKIPQALRPKT